VGVGLISTAFDLSSSVLYPLAGGHLGLCQQCWVFVTRYRQDQFVNCEYARCRFHSYISA